MDESQQSDYMTVGATSDRIVLEAGDFLDVASFSCYNFLWDQAGGFHLFADENDNYTHDYTANAGEALDIKLKHSFCDLMYGIAWVKDVEGFEVYYGTTFGQAEGSVTTDESGNAQITFPNAGTYYIWCDGGIGSDDGTHGSCEHYSETGEPCIVSSPAFAKATVTGATAPEAPRQPQSVTAVLNATLAMQAATVAQPSFGTNYGEWTVFGLARGGYYANDSQYFADYYDRIVEYVNFDANGLSDITVTGNAEGNGFPATFFTITFLAEDVNAGSNLEITMEEMTIKLSSDSGDSNAMLVVDTTECAGSVTVVKGISYSAGCLYTGDGIDHIPANKKAVAVSVVGVESVTKLAYSDGTYEYVFKYSREISEKTGIATYVALVDATIEMENFANKLNFTLTEDAATNIMFGDTNGDGVVNAQDALNAVDAWLRKGDAPTDDQILTLNVNGDSRINTFDALGIVEKFVDGSDLGIVTKAATITTNQ